MPMFEYKAATASGEVEEGVLDVASREQAVEQLYALGQIPIRVDESGVNPVRSRRRIFRPRRVTQAQLTALTRELATLLKAGVSLDHALNTLISLSEDEPLVRLLSSVQEGVRGGSTLTAALQSQEGVFDRFYLNLVRAGEAGGALEGVLERLADHMEESKAVRDSVISALIYPAILVFVSLLSIIILLTYVIPQFTELFQSAGQELPLSTRITIAAGDLVRDYGWLLLLTVLLGGWWLRRQLEEPQSRLRIHGYLLQVSMVREIVSRIEVARFSRTLGSLLTNGVPLLKAMAIAKDTIANQVIAEGVGRVVGSLKAGQPLAEPLAEMAKFPLFAVQMIHVGEESGCLEDMLMKVAAHYDRETQALLSRTLALAEPVLILVMGVTIAGIVMSVLAAILGMNDMVM